MKIKGMNKKVAEAMAEGLRSYNARVEQIERLEKVLEIVSQDPGQSNTAIQIIKNRMHGPYLEVDLDFTFDLIHAITRYRNRLLSMINEQEMEIPLRIDDIE